MLYIHVAIYDRQKPSCVDLYSRDARGQNCAWLAPDADDDLDIAQDFIGQQRAEKLMRHGMVAATVSGWISLLPLADSEQAVSFVVGFGMESLEATFGILAAAMTIVVLAVVPGWVMYRRDSPLWATRK